MCVKEVTSSIAEEVWVHGKPTCSSCRRRFWQCSEPAQRLSSICPPPFALALGIISDTPMANRASEAQKV